jgi:16S rRNA (uracil1498-N3)-methyltransferase
MLPASTDTASIRLFIDAPLAAGAEIAATPAQAHYLGTVMRRAAGGLLRVFNGRDGEWRAHIGAIRKDRATLLVETLLRPQSEEADLWLAFAPLKRDATDMLVQKATELGASALLPVLTERTNSGRVNLDRLAAIAMEAAEQSERLTLPVLHPPRRLPEWLADWPADRPLVAAIERADAPPPPRGLHRAALLIGPEGGFSPAEISLLRSRPCLIPASLGPRVLRAETAGIAGLALLLATASG